MNLDIPNVLVGFAEIAVALAGFTGVVVAFGSRNVGSWHPGDRLRLGFLLEASLTAGGFALASLLLYISLEDSAKVWALISGLWSLYMIFSLYWSRRRILQNQQQHDDIDRASNRTVFVLFSATILLQVYNIVELRSFAPVLVALTLNLTGAGMQFARLIRSAFHE